MLCGSNFLRCCISAISAGLRERCSHSFFSKPTPCSAVIEPPIAVNGLSRSSIHLFFQFFPCGVVHDFDFVVRSNIGKSKNVGQVQGIVGNGQVFVAIRGHVSGIVVAVVEGGAFGGEAVGAVGAWGQLPE